MPDTAAVPTTETPTASAVSFPNANDYEWKLIASGLNRPVDIQPANVGSGRLFIIEKTGYIRIHENRQLLDAPFLDITDRVNDDGNEMGLLGLAFHPDYEQNGFFYVNYTGEGGHTRIYALDPATGSPLWNYESEDGFPKRLYTTEQTLVFVGYQDFMNGVDIRTSELRWRYDTGNWTPSFLGAGDVVYFSSANTLVFALDANTGESIWQFNIPEGTFNYLLDAPILLDGNLYFLTQQGDFFALDASNGQLLWQAATEVSAARTSPAIGNGWLVIGDIEGRVFGYR